MVSNHIVMRGVSVYKLHRYALCAVPAHNEEYDNNFNVDIGGV
jgi:hypothetical protein